VQLLKEGGAGKLEVEGNVSTLLLVPNIEATSIYTLLHLAFDYHELSKMLSYFAFLKCRFST